MPLWAQAKRSGKSPQFGQDLSGADAIEARQRASPDSSGSSSHFVTPPRMGGQMVDGSMSNELGSKMGKDARMRVSKTPYCVQFHIHIENGYEFADEHLLGRELRS